MYKTGFTWILSTATGLFKTVANSTKIFDTPDFYNYELAGLYPSRLENTLT